MPGLRTRLDRERAAPGKLVSEWIRAATRRYRLALLLVGALSLLSHLVLAMGSSQDGERAVAIAVSGRQRMLSQRIAGLALDLALDETTDTSMLRTAVDEMQRANDALQFGDAAIGTSGVLRPETRRLYTRRGGVDDVVTSFLGQVRRFLAAPDGSAAAQNARVLSEQAWGPVLDALEQAVAAHQDESLRQVAWARNVGLGIVAATLLLLVLEVLFVFQPLLRRLGQLGTWLETFWDGERERARRQRAAAAVMAHELRTPVTTLHGLAQTLDSEWDRLLPEQRRFLIGRLRSGSTRMADLVQDINLFAGTSGSVEVEVAYDLAAELASLTVDFPSAELTMGRLHTTIDPRRLRVVATELVRNAVQHGRAPVAVTVDVAQGSMFLRVHDRGPGPVDGERRSLLEPFFRATPHENHSTVDGRHAPGLGLAIVRTLVEELDGTLDFPDVGAGFRVDVRIPVARSGAVVRPLAAAVATNEPVRPAVLPDWPTTARTLVGRSD